MRATSTTDVGSLVPQEALDLFGDGLGAGDDAGVVVVYDGSVAVVFAGVVVDFDVCESNAICMGIVPEVFEVRDDDFLYILQENPSDELRPKVEQAVRQCPKQAISIAEE